MMSTKKRERSITRARGHKKDNRRIYSLCVVAIILIVFACTLFKMNISAHSNHTEEPVNFTYYKSITIHPGDTLWDIAEEYMIEDYKSVADYVTVLKEMNNLHTDDIHAGQALMVAYNDTEFINQ